MAENIDFDTAYELLMKGDDPAPSLPSTPKNNFASLATFSDNFAVSTAITPQRYTFNDPSVKLSPLRADYMFNPQVQMDSLPHLNEIEVGSAGAMIPPIFSPTFDFMKSANSNPHYLPPMDLLSNTETVAIESFLDSIVIKKENSNDPLDHDSVSLEFIQQQSQPINKTQQQQKQQKQQKDGLKKPKEKKVKTKKEENTGQQKKRITFDKDQRKKNHLESEQRRRNQIKEAFDDLIAILSTSQLDFTKLKHSDDDDDDDDEESEKPAKKRRKRIRPKKTPTKLSKSTVLDRAIWEIKTLQMELDSTKC